MANGTSTGSARNNPEPQTFGFIGDTISRLLTSLHLGFLGEGKNTCLLEVVVTGKIESLHTLELKQMFNKCWFTLNQ